MKKIITLALSLSFSFSLLKADYWTQKADFPGLGKLYPFSFSIGNKGYVGCGRDSSPNYPDDFWEYDQFSNAWTQKANYPGGGRYAPTGFSIGSKGYAGLGLISSGGTSNDFWEYNPATNVWTQKANFGGGSGYGAIGFSIDSMGYMGITNTSDLWQYDPIADTWTQKTSFSTPKIEANCFVIGTNGYVVAGYSSGAFLNDLWEYNSISDTWTQKANFPGIGRCDAAGFSICDKGYFGTGEGSGLNNYLNDFWQYNPVTNIWNQKSNVGGLVRNEPAYFSIGNKGYLGLGGQGLSPLFSDFWEYTPDSACATGIDEFAASSLEFTVNPNPAKEFLVIRYPLMEKENLEITITDTQGKKVFQTQSVISNHQFTIYLKGFLKGIYFVEVNDGKEKAVKKFVKE